eukprot:14117200-Alexandrium_andersonii.AAC.1
MAPSPEELLRKLSRVTTIVDDTMTQHALFLNYAVNKTAALIALRGPGSKKLRQQHLSQAAGSLECATMQGPRLLPLVY